MYEILSLQFIEFKNGSHIDDKIVSVSSPPYSDYVPVRKPIGSHSQFVLGH